jgi:hypothetical protein
MFFRETSPVLKETNPAEFAGRKRVHFTRVSRDRLGERPLQDRDRSRGAGVSSMTIRSCWCRCRKLRTDETASECEAATFSIPRPNATTACARTLRRKQVPPLENLANVWKGFPRTAATAGICVVDR